MTDRSVPYYAPFGFLVVVTAILGVLNAVAAHQQRLLVEGSSASMPSIASSESQLQSTFGSSRRRGSTTSSSAPRAPANTGSPTWSRASPSLSAHCSRPWRSPSCSPCSSPVLLILVVVAGVPALSQRCDNSRESYAFEYAMTAESRERGYMLALLTNRPVAKEVRLFGLGRHLRDRYAALTDERIRQLALFLGKRLKVTVIGGVASAFGMAIALVTLVVLLANEVIGVATALTAGLAMQQLAGRLSTITSSVARLIESGMFIDDFHAFIELAPPPSNGDDGDHRLRRRRAPRAACASRTSPSAIRARPRPRSTACRSKSEPARSSRWSARTARGRPRWSS